MTLLALSDPVLLALISLPASIITAAAVLVSAWHSNRHTRRAALKLANQTSVTHAETSSKLGENKEKLDHITVLVNSRMSEALARIDMLEDALLKAGHEVPEPDPDAKPRPPRHLTDPEHPEA